MFSYGACFYHKPGMLRPGNKFLKIALRHSRQPQLVAQASGAGPLAHGHTWDEQKKQTLSFCFKVLNQQACGEI